MTAIDPRPCEGCGNEYTPKRIDQKFCPECGPGGKNIKKKAATAVKKAATKSLALSRLTGPSMGLPADAGTWEWEYDELVLIWHQVDNFSQWVKGDLALLVETEYGQGRLKKFADDVGVDFSTLKSYRTVAKRWPEKSRHLDISWSVHQALASQDDREELLANQDWTLAEARELVKERKTHAGAVYAEPEDTDDTEPDDIVESLRYLAWQEHEGWPDPPTDPPDGWEPDICDTEPDDTEPDDTGTEETADTGTSTSFDALTEGAGTGEGHRHERTPEELNAGRAVEARKALGKAASWLHDAAEHIGWITDPAICTDLSPDLQAVLNALNVAKAAQLAGAGGIAPSQADPEVVSA